MAYALFELVLGVFLTRHVYVQYRGRVDAVKGTLVAVAISAVLFLCFSLLVPNCRLWLRDDVFSSLYGAEVNACFHSPKLRFALSPLLALVISTVVVAGATVLTTRWSRRR
jgi:hypothetical protein